MWIQTSHVIIQGGHLLAIVAAIHLHHHHKLALQVHHNARMTKHAQQMGRDQVPVPVQVQVQVQELRQKEEGEQVERRMAAATVIHKGH